MWERGPIDDAAEGSVWRGLQRARARVVDAMGSVADNFTTIITPALDTFASVLEKIDRWTNPRTGNPAVSMGVLAAGGVGAFMLARSVLGRMGTWPRTLIGGGAGALLGGGIESALMGAMIARGFGGGTAAAAAGAAGAAAGQSWGRRFVGGALRFLRSTILSTIVITAVGTIVSNWEMISTRLKEIWEDLRKAAPVWAGGEGQGWGAIGNSQGGFGGLGRDIHNSLLGMGIVGPEHGTPYITRRSTTSSGRGPGGSRRTSSLGRGAGPLEPDHGHGASIGRTQHGQRGPRRCGREHHRAVG